MQVAAHIFIEKGDYYPVKLLKSYFLDELPTENRFLVEIAELQENIA